MSTSLRNKKSPLIFEIIFFALAAVFLFWRARQGHYFNDESFLIGLAQRLYNGDAPIADEWHVCQNTGVLLLPFYALFYKMTGSVEGIILFFRNAYTLLFFLSVLVMHLKLRDLRPWSYAAVLATVLYAPLDFMTLSYTTLSFLAMLLICCIIYKDVLTDWAKPLSTGIILGLLSTVATLSYPYFAAFFVLYYLTLIVALPIAMKKCGGEMCQKLCYILKLSLSMAGTIAVMVLLYGAFILSRADVHSLILNMPEIFNDPQHPTRSFFVSLYDAVYTSLLTARGSIFHGFVYYFVSAALCLVAILWKKKKPYRIFIFLILFALWLFNVFPFFMDSFLKVNRHMKEFFTIGLLSFLLLEKKPWKLFLSFYPASLIYAIVIWFSSNTGTVGVSMGFALGTICALVFVLLLSKELYEQYKPLGTRRFAAASFVALAAIGQLSLQARVRFSYTYLDDALWTFTEIIERGPEKGIHTTPKHAAEYYANYDSITIALSGHDTAGKSLLALNSEPIIYLAADMHCQSYSTWMLGDENTSTRVRKYYDINGRPSPDYIFDGDGSADISIITEDSYRLEQHGQARLYIKE